jgi:predicted RNA-binding protein with PIN domain
MHRIIIDGYNLLFYNNRYSFSLNEGKTVVDLISVLLQEFQPLPLKIKKRLVFVFDGNKTASGNPKEQAILGFKVIFSFPGKSADDKIIEMVRKSKNPKSILVVTNDNAIINSVSRLEARTNKIADFIKWLGDMTKEESKEEGLSKKKFDPKLSENEVVEWENYFSKKE